MNEDWKKKRNRFLILAKWQLRKLKRLFVVILRLLGQCFSKLKYKTRFVIVLSVVLAIGAFVGYEAGKQIATAEATKQEKALKEELKMQTAALEEQLKEKTEEEKLKDPKKRPWNLVLVNDKNPMEEGYVPKLVNIGGRHKVDERIEEPLKRMLEDAKKAGLKPRICSSYRDVEYQKKLYNLYMERAVKQGMNYWEALKKTKDSTAYPGRSEHHLGLALDIVSATYTELDKQQEQTAEAKWLAENCYKYGFILRYPNGKTDVTGIVYEPWHYRYVGEKAAKEITEMGITLEEYLGEV